ncbi:hypothetical protein, partial [Staphylococcus aureus]|uniref:hypothetical protein n=1 Tax=Staphylococcus aureus TaxID=1280 RepID=UPI00065BA62B
FNYNNQTSVYQEALFEIITAYLASTFGVYTTVTDNFIIADDSLEVTEFYVVVLDNINIDATTLNDIIIFFAPEYNLTSDI